VILGAAIHNSSPTNNNAGRLSILIRSRRPCQSSSTEARHRHEPIFEGGGDRRLHRDIGFVPRYSQSRVVKRRYESTTLLMPWAGPRCFGNAPAAAAKDKRSIRERHVESIEAVPCGAKQRGLTAGQRLWIGRVEHVNSDEKLCRSICSERTRWNTKSPIDSKHPPILPIGHEGDSRSRRRNASQGAGRRSKKNAREPITL